jgi:hypothetical protein
MNFHDGICPVEKRLMRKRRYIWLSLSKKKVEIIFREIDQMRRMKWNGKITDLLFFSFTAAACILAVEMQLKRRERLLLGTV